MNDQIKILITGGTIDCERIEENDKYIFEETYLPEMLKQGKCKVNVELEILMMKDSLFLDDNDRKLILEKCKTVESNKIIVTHGTDTMPETARLLGKENLAKTIVLLGAMVPFNQPASDALFNLGAAITAVQLLNNGVYISMNGKIFHHDNVKKNKELGEFQALDGLAEV